MAPLASSADRAALTVGPRVAAARARVARTGASSPAAALGARAEARAGVAAPASSATSSRPPISLARTGAMVRSPACAGAGRRPGRGLVGESMTTGNRPIRASCALAALIFATLPVAGCGGGGSHHTATGSSEPVSQLVSRALGGGAAVRSGQVRLSLSLLAPGARQAFTLRSATRFSVASTGAAPSLALTLATLSRAGSAPAQQLRAALVSGPKGSR